MTTISPVASTTSAIVAPPRKQPTIQDIRQKDIERAVIIAKQKPENERTWEDYLALAADAFQRLLAAGTVLHANQDSNVNYLA